MQIRGAGDDVLLYTEQQLRRIDDDTTPVAREGGPRLVPQLLAAESSAQREALVRGMLHAIGFEWFAYGSEVQQGGRSLPKSFLTSYSHPQWTRRYFSERYHEVDPRHADAPRSGLPMVWDQRDLDERLRPQAFSGRARRFIEDMRDCGIRSGIFFQLPSPTAANERIAISLSSSEPTREWIGERVLGQALTLGLCMHELMSRHLRPIQADGDDLSALQHRILHCLRCGQSDKEIAHVLQLSIHAVDYHMRQLRRRFAVRNRVQLINAAMG